jgi:uncharacterized protein
VDIYTVVIPESLVAADPVLDLIARTIVERVHPERILLFGSRARGDAHAYSDYDIMVIMDTDPLAGDVACAIHNAFPTPKTFSMDVVLRTPAQAERMREDVGTLVYAAEHEGRVLYVRPGSEWSGNTTGPAARVREERQGPPESLASWMRRVENDFRIAENELRDPLPTWDGVCFHIHEGVEKLLKCVLIATNTPPPRTHLLGDLLALCPGELQANLVVHAACATLTSLWPRARYPDEGPEPTAAEGALAVAAGRDVRAVVLPLLERLISVRTTSSRSPAAPSSPAPPRDPS